MLKKFIILGCLTGASFFVACHQQDSEPDTGQKSAPANEAGEKELEMYEVSELAALMRQMYDDNLALKKRILNGELPENFPEEFKKIHSAEATNPEEINDTYQALAEEYIKNMEAIASAPNTAEAKIAYNAMVGTCASCHQIYCQGPLAKIRRMRFKPKQMGE